MKTYPILIKDIPGQGRALTGHEIKRLRERINRPVSNRSVVVKIYEDRPDIGHLCQPHERGGYCKTGIIVTSEDFKF